MLSSFDHPNIVKFHEVYEGVSSFYLITEMLNGMSLQ